LAFEKRSQHWPSQPRTDSSLGDTSVWQCGLQPPCRSCSNGNPSAYSHILARSWTKYAEKAVLRNVLLVGVVLAKVGDVVLRLWLVGVFLLLGDQSDSSPLVWLDADSLVIDEAFEFPRVLVRQVDRVARELHAAA